MATKTRLKSTAAQATPQSRESVQNDIKELGDLQRQHARELADVNDKVAQLTQNAAPSLGKLQKSITTLQAGVQTWCEANREELCGKGKTANLITGEVSWRQRPPSVTVRGVEAVIAALKRMKLTRFIRLKVEVNKDALLTEIPVAKTVPGITINTGAEDFIIAPFELETPKAAGATA
jgi:phage host-nuclease inhibitor protein Gam